MSIITPILSPTGFKPHKRYNSINLFLFNGVFLIPLFFEKKKIRVHQLKSMGSAVPIRISFCLLNVWILNFSYKDRSEVQS